MAKVVTMLAKACWLSEDGRLTVASQAVDIPQDDVYSGQVIKDASGERVQTAGNLGAALKALQGGQRVWVRYEGDSLYRLTQMVEGSDPSQAAGDDDNPEGLAASQPPGEPDSAG
jgi:hypothetical protein